MPKTYPPLATVVTGKDSDKDRLGLLGARTGIQGAGSRMCSRYKIKRIVSQLQSVMKLLTIVVVSIPRRAYPMSAFLLLCCYLGQKGTAKETMEQLEQISVGFNSL